jgi:antitoxin component of RelBE/YafQ-DinJ toxin-antitoxin module
LKKLVTFRLDSDLLAEAKRIAERENRTLTNFVETVLKKAVEEARVGAGPMSAALAGKQP